MKRFILCALFSVLCSLTCEAQWGGGRCRGQAPVGVAQTTHRSPLTTHQQLRWERVGGHNDQVHLYRGNAVLGLWWYADGCFYANNAGQWSETSSALPAGAPPVPAKQGDDPQANFGVELGKLVPAGQEKVSVNGLPSDKYTAQAAVEAGVPDDVAKLRLTVIGDAAARGAVLRDLAGSAELAAWKDKLLVQGYAPDHWAVAKAGFHTGGRPTIYLQAPDGKVLHRQDDYDGARSLADAIRKADPNYKPEQDPDKRKPDPPPLLPKMPEQIPEWAIVAGIGAAALLVFRKR